MNTVSTDFGPLIAQINHNDKEGVRVDIRLVDKGHSQLVWMAKSEDEDEIELDLGVYKTADDAANGLWAAYSSPEWGMEWASGVDQ